MIDWNDVRYFLAIQRAGTLAGAARALAVEHSTMGRRLAALETALGVKLFTRTPGGLLITAPGAEIVPLAEHVEQAVEALMRRVQGSDARPEGTVRLATSESFSSFVVKRLPDLRARHPAIQLEVLSGNANLDLSKGEADLAVRLASTSQPELLCRRVGSAGWSVYAAESYLERAPVADLEDLTGHDVIGFDESLSNTPGAIWLAPRLRGARVVLRGNSLPSVLNAAIVGMGICVLPCFMAVAEPSLRRLTPAVVGSRDIFLVVHPDRARIARVRAVMDFMVEQLGSERELLTGERS